jgi:hypothetical protein
MCDLASNQLIFLGHSQNKKYFILAITFRWYTLIVDLLAKQMPVDMTMCQVKTPVRSVPRHYQDPAGNASDVLSAGNAENRKAANRRPQDGGKMG